MQIWFATQGEMSATVIYHPTQYSRLQREVKARLLDGHPAVWGSNIKARAGPDGTCKTCVMVDRCHVIEQVGSRPNLDLACGNYQRSLALDATYGLLLLASKACNRYRAAIDCSIAHVASMLLSPKPNLSPSSRAGRSADELQQAVRLRRGGRHPSQLRTLAGAGAA